MNCKICGSEALQQIASLPLETVSGAIKSEITKCLTCNTYSRSLDYSDSEVRSHFELASYTDPRYEKQFLESKRTYFEYILRLIRSFKIISSKKASCLDIGSSYGHMLDVFTRNGITVEGVEIVDRLREDLKKRGYQVYKTIAEVPRDNVYDIITFIDSLYYFEDPVEALSEVRPHLRAGGILVIRIPNRTPFLNLTTRLGIPVNSSLFLDAKHNFSFKGVRIMFGKTGFKLVKVVVKEKGKKPIVNEKGIGMPVYKRIYGKVSEILCSISGTKLGKFIAPGLLIFGKPEKPVPGAP